MRHRRRRYSRPKTNYVWQPLVFSGVLSTGGAVEDNGFYEGLIKDFVPGAHGGGNTDHPFDNDHVLERVVGSMSHNGAGQLANQPGWFPFSIGAVRVPSGFSTPNTMSLFDPQQGEDYFFRHDTVCNAIGTADAIPNWHDVNSKAKRKFEPGDKMAFLWSLMSPITSTRPITVELAFNLRLLWKLT